MQRNEYFRSLIFCTSSRAARAALAIASVFALTLVLTQPAEAQGYRVLYSFTGGADGGTPYAGLIFDAAGNLYGTTYAGGVFTGDNCFGGCGVVFELMPQAGGGWAEQVLYGFCAQTSCTDGASPHAGLILDAAGNLYGTTEAGGGINVLGTVFELTATGGGGWTEQVLHVFVTLDTDGLFPYAGLILDAAGNLYGTTTIGGAYERGTAFELTPEGGGSWQEKFLHNFGNGTDGSGPYAGLIFDAAGNLYGTTSGLYSSAGYGTVFELTPQAVGDWPEQVLYSFDNGPDGGSPYAGLIFDAAGNLYGTTEGGGAYGGGTVFELTPKEGGGWKEQVLHNFGNGTDGASPYAGLIFDAAGNLYGTTNGGGTYGYGTVFELTPRKGGGWNEQVLHSFNNTNGASPYAGLIFDAAGNLYGTTTAGGASGYGVVFEITAGGNAVDISNSAGSDVPWSEILQSGIQNTVVATWMGKSPNLLASEQLIGAQAAGLGTAAYLELDLSSSGLKTYSGAQQAQFGVNLVNPFLTKDLAFVAIAVQYFPPCEKEPTKPKCYPQDPDSIQARKDAISQAVQTLQNVQITSVLIYTRRDQWQVLTGDATNFSLAGIGLWDVFQAKADSTTREVIPNLSADCLRDVQTGDINCVRFKGYGGWTSRVGQQYQTENTAAFGVDVDFDLFSASLSP